MGDAKHPEKKLDKAVEDSFPASDPPSHTPKEGTRKAEQIAAAQDAEDMTPKGHPTSDRAAAETAAGRIEGEGPPQQKPA